MENREDVARFIENQLGANKCSREKYGKAHYGFQELRELMDFIYSSTPNNEKEMLINPVAEDFKI